MKKILPNFLCVGVEKCGTTSLYELLLQHPQIGLSSHKETFYFNTNWNRGPQWYYERFQHLNPEQHTAIGEITPSYYRSRLVVSRIVRTLGRDTKIIFMLREPCKRAFSHYIHNMASRFEEDYVFRTHLKTSRYARAVKRYFNIFGQHNCLVLIFEEDFLPDQQIAVDKVCDFLGVDRFTVTAAHSNPSWLPRFCQSPGYPSYIDVEEQRIDVPANTPVIYTHRAKTTRVLATESDAEIKHLRKVIESATTHIPALNVAIVHKKKVRSEVERLEQLIGRDLTCWKEHDQDLTAKVAPEPQFLAT